MSICFKTFLFQFSWTSLAINDKYIIACAVNIMHFFFYKKFKRCCFYTVYMKYSVMTFILTDN